MSLSEVKQKARIVRLKRAEAVVAEAELKLSLMEFVKHGAGKTFAQSLDISPQYLSDIRYGRRLVSDEFVDRLCGKNGARR